MSSEVEISVIAPCYNEESNLDAFLSRLCGVLNSLVQSSDIADYEVLVINDGSTDGTAEKLTQLKAHYPQLRVINFSRNFGKEAALTAGLDFARGKAVIPIDIDLQDPPEVIPEMVQKWRQGWKVVLATRKSREGETITKIATASLFYKLIHRMSDSPMPTNTGDFRLLDRSVIDVIKQLKEKNRFMKGLLSWPGFPTTQIFYKREPRHSGRSKWSIRGLIGLAFNGFFSFSSLPLKLSTYVGMLISLGAFGMAAIIIWDTIVNGVETPGYASTITIVLFLGGIQLLAIGIIGEYVGRIYNETKGRPIYVVESRLD
jgi:glycosyltransferase involved in cell wall biosynthesis